MGRKNETVFIALHWLYIGGLEMGCFEGFLFTLRLAKRTKWQGRGVVAAMRL